MEGSRRVLCLRGIEHWIQAYAQQQESMACAQQSMAFDSSSTECLQCPSAGRKSRGKERHQKQQHQQQQLRASLRRQEEKTAAAGIIRRRGKQQRQLHQPLRSLNVHDCCAGRRRRKQHHDHPQHHLTESILQLVLESQLLRKIVHLLFSLTDQIIKLTVLCGS